MKHIDKNPLRSYFDAYTRRYLHDASPEGVFFPELSSKTTYSNFNKAEYKDSSIPEGTPYKGWLEVLLAEQNHLCCYCMRHIEKQDVSVEHLVPESLPRDKAEEEYDYYASFSAEISEHVMTGQAFDKLAVETDVDIEHLERMPHLIAHSNLFPACNAKRYACSCNNHRKSERILPLMLMTDIEENVEYTENGEMALLYEETEDKMVERTNTALDINSKRLRSIRKLWYKFSRKGLFCEWNHTVTYPEMDNMVRIALDLAITDVIPIEYQDLLKEEADGSLKNFSLFLQYNWFYNYYLNKYPIQQA